MGRELAARCGRGLAGAMTQLGGLWGKTVHAGARAELAAGCRRGRIAP